MNKMVIIIIMFAEILASGSYAKTSHNEQIPNTGKNRKQSMLLTKDQKKVALDIIAAFKAGHVYLPEQDEHVENIEAFFDHLFLCTIAENPQLLTVLSVFEAVGVHEHNAYLNNVLPESYIKIFEQKKKNLEFLKKIDLKKLTPEQAISYKIFLWYLEHQAEGHQFIFHEYFVTQLMGIITDLSYLLTVYQPLVTEQNVEHYLARLEKISNQLEQLLILLEHQNSKR